MRRRFKIAALYAGGLLGPLGGGVVAPMLPQIGGSVHASSAAVATSLTAYFVPFAVLQLASGTLGERWGVRRTVQVAYLVYALASAGCALAPTLPAFLAGRALMGSANAFTSPLLLAGLGAAVPPGRLSRSVGIYSSFQAAGQSFAPLLGGVAAVWSWRLAFVVVAATAVLLAFAPPPGDARPGAEAPEWRPLLSGRMGLLSAGAFLSYICASALPFLVALYAGDALSLRPDLTGLALVGFGVAGLLLGSVWGSVTDRFGPRVCGVLATVATAVFVAAIGRTGSVPALIVCWTAAGAGASMLTVALQNLTMRAVPGNRGGALSAVSAFRFAGAALAPVAWLPLYHAAPSRAFGAAGASLLLAVPALRATGRADH
ncbi:MFS transporter [Actinoallomurus iriomotensis]|uniref:MFS transporter n=1 Tax=Actinoallomurus iriomotensis TaxID=478107 RepID=A0A9W6VX42_9ACTN|nr:MFS transporter [Actinoallomurus iriomotensis]GLY82252.1 MFS transporter [Actinoallomurus iriomotensis]